MRFYKKNEFFFFNNCICNYFNRYESDQQQFCRIALALLRENVCFEKLRRSNFKCE